MAVSSDPVARLRLACVAMEEMSRTARLPCDAIPTISPARLITGAPSCPSAVLRERVSAPVLGTAAILAQQEAPVEEPQPPGAQISPEGGGGGSGAIIAVVLLLAGGGAAAAFLLKPKENGPNGPPVNGGSGVGSIRIVIPGR